MKKQAYSRPALSVVSTTGVSIMSGSVTEIDGNAGLHLGGGGSGDARSDDNDDVWDDYDD